MVSQSEKMNVIGTRALAKMTQCIGCLAIALNIIDDRLDNQLFVCEFNRRASGGEGRKFGGDSCWRANVGSRQE